MDTIPNELKCIVTDKLMDDPVTCDDRFTYDI